jgi:signal transduction histidine kinase
MKPRIFQPLFSTKAKGQGFGLAVVKRLVEGLKGQITFDSEVGEGTTFTVTIPIKQETNH